MRKINKFLFGLIVLAFSIGLVINVNISNVEAIGSNQLKIHFIDVGQADSILVQQGSSNMLIDAGNNDDGVTVVNYLKKQGIKNLNVVVGTHPHEDHIGGLDTVIKTFALSKVYMPKVTTTTKTFKDLIAAIKGKKLTITTPKPNTSFKVGKANCTILAPNSSSYKDLNDYSIVIKVTYGSKSFLLTGDAEAISEKEMINKKYNLSADVLKVGHHGSESSTSVNFLKKVKPKYAVISVGKDNSYGHPNKGTIDKLTKAGVKIFRTDNNGNIVATSDGKTISFSTAKSSNNSVTKAVIDSNIVYMTKTGTKYHLDGCSSLSDSKIKITLKEAKDLGLEPCSKCNPPQ